MGELIGPEEAVDRSEGFGERLLGQLLDRAHEMPPQLIAPLVAEEVRAIGGRDVSILLQDYAHLFDEPEGFKQTLARYTLLHGKKVVQRWQDMIDADARAPLFTELIELHYDPAYARSSGAHFQGLDRALRCTLTGDADDCRAQARELLRRLDGAAPRIPGITVPTP